MIFLIKWRETEIDFILYLKILIHHLLVYYIFVYYYYPAYMFIYIF